MNQSENVCIIYRSHVQVGFNCTQIYQTITATIALHIINKYEKKNFIPDSFKKEAYTGPIAFSRFTILAKTFSAKKTPEPVMFHDVVGAP